MKTSKEIHNIISMLYYDNHGKNPRDWNKINKFKEKKWYSEEEIREL